MKLYTRYKDFLNEALKPEQSEKYKHIKVVKEVENIHSKIFGNAERLYIPFDFSYFKMSEKSKIQEDVEEVFANSEYEIISYEQNQCRKKNNKNVTKIGKVLNSKLNKPELAVQYGQDVEKSRNLAPTDDMYVCISRNSDDIASMSTGRSWTSCQNLDKYDYSHNRVYEDIEQGTIIAYLIKSTDKEIEDPEARILLKPFINNVADDDIVLLPSTVPYFRGKGINNSAIQKYPRFGAFMMSWCKMIQPDLDGTYIMQRSVYQDGQTRIKLKKGNGVDDINYMVRAMELPDDTYRNPSTTTSFFDGMYEVYIELFEDDFNNEMEEVYRIVIVDYSGDCDYVGYEGGRIAKNLTKEEFLIKYEGEFLPIESDYDGIEISEEDPQDAETFMLFDDGNIENADGNINIFNECLVLFNNNQAYTYIIKNQEDGEYEASGTIFGKKELLDEIEYELKSIQKKL